MTTVAQLDSDSVRLDAGGEAVVPLQIRNTGDTVEGYHIEVVGVPASWTTVEQPDVTLFPGATTTTTINFRPPRSSAVPAGSLQFGVRVVPTEHPEEAVVPEGVVELLPFLETTAELVPRTSRGRRGGRHQLAVDNRGNVPLTLVLVPADPAQALTMRVRPEGLTVDPGHAAFADLRLRARKTVWKGAPITHPFTVAVSPVEGGGQAVSLDGSHLQEAVLPPWLTKALLALLALLLLLAGVWFLLLKPTIESAARNAVDQPVKTAANQAAVARQQAAAAQKQADQAKQAASSASDQNQGAQGAVAKVQKLTGLPVSLSQPFSSRLELATASKGTGTKVFAVPAKQSLDLTDLVLQNPQGDFGTVTLSLGTQTLFDMALENFRDIDYHFVSPINAKAGDKLTMKVRCNGVGKPPGATPAPTTCDTALYFGGTITKPKA